MGLCETSGDFPAWWDWQSELTQLVLLHAPRNASASAARPGLSNFFAASAPAHPFWGFAIRRLPAAVKGRRGAPNVTGCHSNPRDYAPNSHGQWSRAPTWWCPTEPVSPPPPPARRRFLTRRGRSF